MLRIHLVHQEVCDRQAALRRAGRLGPAAHPNPLRRQLGAWIVRLGRAIAGPSPASARSA